MTIFNTFSEKLEHLKIIVVFMGVIVGYVCNVVLLNDCNIYRKGTFLYQTNKSLLTGTQFSLKVSCLKKTKRLWSSLWKDYKTF